MPRIFISYRRADSKPVADRIHDRLVNVFGERDVFEDVSNIPVGKDFPEIISKAANECRVMLVVIGSNWLTITDKIGNRRLDNPNDFVRREIEIALENKHTKVIPLLINGANMPREDELPASLSKLSSKQAFFIRFDPHDDSGFRNDMEALIGRLPSPRPEWKFPLWLSLITAFLLVALALRVLQPILNQQIPTQTVSITATSKPAEIDTQVVQVMNSPESSGTLQPTSTFTNTFIPFPTLQPTFTPRDTAQPAVTLQLTDTPPPTNIPTSTATPDKTGTNLFAGTVPVQLSTNTPTRATVPPQQLGQITIMGNSSDGTSFVAPQTGTYFFRYKTGAYSTQPDGASEWRTAIYGFFEQIQWATDGDKFKIDNFRAAMVVADPGKTFPDEQSAINAALGRRNWVFLRAGETLILVAVDHLNWYDGNPGSVILDVSYTP